MGLLDLPIVILRFPQGIKDLKNALALEIDVTGDVCMKLPAKRERFLEAVEAFSVFWSGNDKERLMNLLKKIFNDWKKPTKLAANWNSYKKKLEEEFDGDFRRKFSELETFLKNPFDCLTEILSLEDLSILEVQTRSHKSRKPFIVTKVDWKGDFFQIVAPVALGKPEFFRCHAQGVDLALFIKSALGDFLIKLIRRPLLAL
jgi:hypothetical protein